MLGSSLPERNSDGATRLVLGYAKHVVGEAAPWRPTLKTRTLNVAAIRAEFPILARTVRGQPLVYLDNAATSQKPRAMIERIDEVYRHEYARVEEGHTLSREATKSFEGTRARVAQLLNAAEPREIIFCRGATEALNLVSRMIQHQGLGAGDEILITEMEHHSNIGPWLMACQETGATLKVVPITPSGDLDLTRLEEMLSERTKILAVTHVSNVTGTINPVKRITAMAKARGIPVLVDAHRRCRTSRSTCATSAAISTLPPGTRWAARPASGSFTGERMCWKRCPSPIPARPCRRT